MKQTDNTNTKESLQDAAEWFEGHKISMTGIWAGDYIDKEDFMKHINYLVRQAKQDAQTINKLVEALKNIVDNTFTFENSRKTVPNEFIYDAKKLLQSLSKE